MDLGTIGGIIGGLGLLLGAIIVGGGDLAAYIDVGSFFVTVGGTTAALFVAFPMKRIFRIADVASHAFSQYEVNPGVIINSLVGLSEKARREGLLSLEDDLEGVNDPFLRKGIQLVVDGTDPELVKVIMLTDLDKIEARHYAGREFFDMGGILAPAFGMIGTLMGLIQMLANLTDKASIGVGMALALITTLYGAIISNLMFIPLAKKLEGRNNDEVLIKEIMLEGVLSIQSGDNPRIVKDKLISFLSPSVRKKIDEALESS